MRAGGGYSSVRVNVWVFHKDPFCTRYFLQFTLATNIISHLYIDITQVYLSFPANDTEPAVDQMNYDLKRFTTLRLNIQGK